MTGKAYFVRLWGFSHREGVRVDEEDGAQAVLSSEAISMFEFLFILTAVYLAYVAYEAYQAVERAEKGEPIFKPRPPAVASTAAATAPAVPVRVQPAKPAAAGGKKPAAPRPEPVAKATPAASATLADELRNPATGELSPVPTNYRFAKKWIKDALVSEKLLDRVYKPSELDDATALKVKEAIEKLRAIKKYQA
ncbi:hypothetical protein JCM19379_04870 [Methyloparacoccus murrellii]